MRAPFFSVGTASSWQPAPSPALFLDVAAADAFSPPCRAVPEWVDEPVNFAVRFMVRPRSGVAYQEFHHFKVLQVAIT